MESNNNKEGAASKLTKDILDDLCSRFIINVPEEERTDLIRLCFQIELAHWFYIDFYCAEDNFKSCGIKEFAYHIFKHVPSLKPHLETLDKVLEKWKEYKMAVPTYGAILLDTDLTHVLLVQGYWTKSSWGFPKGKVNKEEDPVECAAREVLEETGFDIAPLMNPKHFIETTMNEQLARLYLVPGVSRETKFQPRTRNEIRSVEWFPVADLPCSKKEVILRGRLGHGHNTFFMVMPFVKRLKKWISERRSFLQQKGSASTNGTRRQRHKSVGDLMEKTSASSTATNQRNRRQQNNSQQLTQSEARDGHSPRLHTSQAATQQQLQFSASPPLKNHHKKIIPDAVWRNKSFPRRQLFTDDNKGKIQTANSEEVIWSSPAWVNFRLDYGPILACLNVKQ